MGCHATELNHFRKPYKMDLTLTNRQFSYGKFRVFIRLTVKSVVSHPRITWSEWQTYKDRITRIFGEYTWRPSLLQGTTKLCSLTGSPQVIFNKPSMQVTYV